MRYNDRGHPGASIVLPTMDTGAHRFASPIHEEAIIALRNVGFSYGETPVVRDVSFEVFRGGTTVILGASGSGKTTLLRLILGLLKPDTGSIMVDGHNISAMSEKHLMKVRQEMGVVFQEGALFDSLNVRDNVGFRLMEARCYSAGEIDRRVLELLETVELGDIREMMPEELSGGMKRRVAIARALAGEPEILLYDEPTTGLDPIVCEAICNLILKLRDRQGISSVVVTHDLSTALMVGDRFVVLREGQVIFEGTGEALMAAKEPYLRKFMGAMRDRCYD